MSNEIPRFNRTKDELNNNLSEKDITSLKIAALNPRTGPSDRTKELSERKVSKIEKTIDYNKLVKQLEDTTNSIAGILKEAVIENSGRMSPEMKDRKKALEVQKKSIESELKELTSLSIWDDQDENRAVA